MRLRKLLIALTLCLSLSVVASAHPGRTDSNGGHIDHSTGEYHYHHGYQAHQHYDKDGDGYLDCPYSFSDKTESATIKKNPTDDKTESATIKTEPTKEASKKGTVEDYFKLICCLVLVVLFLAGFFVDPIKKRFKK